MENNLQNTKKSKPTYNYSALATHVALNYTIFKTGKDYQKLLNKIFNEHIKVENSVYFLKNSSDETIGSGRYTFYATRYDYLRIAKTIMEDWNNDTCIGKYLQNIYESRIMVASYNLGCKYRSCHAICCKEVKSSDKSKS